MSFQKKIQLTRILGLLGLRIVAGIAASLIHTHSPIVDQVLLVFLKISDIVIILFLYQYLKKEKQLTLPFWTIIMIIVIRIYYIIIGFFPIPMSPDTPLGDRILISMLPTLLLDFALVVLSLKLMSNELDETTKPLVKRIGIAQLIYIGAMLIFMKLPVDQFPGMILINILWILPLAAMAHFYWEELKRVE